MNKILDIVMPYVMVIVIFLLVTIFLLNTIDMVKKDEYRLKWTCGSNKSEIIIVSDINLECN